MQVMRCTQRLIRMGRLPVGEEPPGGWTDDSAVGGWVAHVVRPGGSGGVRRGGACGVCCRVSCGVKRRGCSVFEPREAEMQDEMVCYCKRVTEGTIVRAIRAGATTLAAIQRATGACTGNRCKELNPKGRCCSPEIQALIDRECGGGAGPSGCCCGG